ncbi:hypothetical protein PV10_00604 [Exophiala mesophila]|uniref:Uncharacterized protein n=1 Tax=Exophiala mesophila TaxID=212818 RepID=A0A0D1Y7P4_EXOME|nr:uncharacterized protein PV10_00604 [Exophiala mesophila]KIV96786.1 hypothetical protein PV10_00604 [Exophiala mesophila]
MAISKPSLTDLIKNLKLILQSRYSATKQNSRDRHPLSKMEPSEPQDYVTRTALQEIDTVEISPLHPEYMVIGTYSLVKTSEPRDYEAQTRKGTLQILPVSSIFKPKYAGMLPPSLDKLDFSCAIVDIHFHPSDPSLLGAATSIGEIHFFRFIKHGDVLGRRVLVRLIPLGIAKVAEDDQHGLSALVTQFTWLPDLSTHGIRDLNDFQRVGLAFTTSFGDTKIASLEIPAIRDLNDHRVSSTKPPDVHFKREQVSHHELEAWTVSTFPLASTHDNTTCLVLSGGDDSALLAAQVTLPNLSSSQFDEDQTITSSPLWKERRTHTAGVVAILPLPRIRTTTSSRGGPETVKEIVPLVTGSYDEILRVFELDLVTFRPTLKTEISLSGGVWRLKVLDQYSTLSLHGASNDEHLIDKDQKIGIVHDSGRQDSDLGNVKQHTLILASLMHTGAMLLRLTYSHRPLPGEDAWTVTPLTKFRAGHESMVYCCDASLEVDDQELGGMGSNPSEPLRGQESETRDSNGKGKDKASPTLDANTQHHKGSPPMYTVVSTSFYDMKICTWKFVDEYKATVKHNAAASGVRIGK